MPTMTQSLDLLTEARKRFDTDAALCKALDVTYTTVAVAKTRGKTSPVLAGRLAQMLGENVEHWMAMAALESAPRSRVTDQLRRTITALRKSEFTP